MKNKFVRHIGLITFCFVVGLSLTTAIFIRLIGLEGYEIIVVPLFIGLMMLYLPVRQWNITKNDKRGLLHKLISVQLLLNIIVGAILVSAIFVSLWRAAFCPKTKLFDDEYVCTDNFHDLFLDNIGAVQENIFDKLHIGAIWFFVPMSILLTVLLVFYILISRKKI